MIRETPDGIRFGIWGTKVSYPAPTLFVFSATIDESLGDPYYRQCGNALAEQGFLCVSLDLPGHGLDQRDDEPGGLTAWRVRSDRGEDFVTPFTKRARQVLDYLIQAGYTDPERVAACGTSRGGFMALQLTAVEPRIRATVAFAPVTALGTLREFHGTAIGALPIVNQLRDRMQLERFSNQHLPRDRRTMIVSTSRCLLLLLRNILLLREPIYGVENGQKRSNLDGSNSW